MREELGGCGVIFDCSDNAATKLCLNQTAFDLDALLISASVEGLEGQLLAVDPGTPGCLACLWKGPLGEDRSGAPVLGPVPAVLGAMQALEGLKHLLDLPGRLRNEIVYYDGLGQRMERMALPREADCPVCGG
jgi:sulfur carrier protein ThiS adenylyltransferase